MMKIRMVIRVGIRNSPDGFVSLRDRGADNTIYDMYASH